MGDTLHFVGIEPPNRVYTDQSNNTFFPYVCVYETLAKKSYVIESESNTHLQLSKTDPPALADRSQNISATKSNIWAQTTMMIKKNWKLDAFLEVVLFITWHRYRTAQNREGSAKGAGEGKYS